MVKWSVLAFFLLRDGEPFLQALQTCIQVLGGPTRTTGLSAQVICAGMSLVLRASITAVEDCNEETPFTEKLDMISEPLLEAGYTLCVGDTEKHGSGPVLQGPAA